MKKKSVMAVSPKVIQYPYITQKTKRLGESLFEMVSLGSLKLYFIKKIYV